MKKNTFFPYFRLILNENFQWRACRLLSMYSPHFYTVNTSVQYLKIPEFLNDMVKKVAQDYPVSLILFFFISRLKIMKFSSIKGSIW